MQSLTLFTISVWELALASLLGGVTAHLAFFIRKREFHPLTQPLFASIFLLPLITTVSLMFHERSLPNGTSSSYTFSESVYLTWIIYFNFAFGLFSSIFVYRAWLHPLGHIPGPFFARVSKFYSFWKQLRTKHQWHYELKKLHDKYGDVVRIGPNEVSICHPGLCRQFATFSKGTFYEYGYVALSLQTIRNPTIHKERRKVWDQAFTLKAIQDGYVPRIIFHGNKLLSHLRATAQTPVNMTELFNWYAFDLMGDLSFGKKEGFGLIEAQGRGDSGFFMRVTHHGERMIGLMMHISWVVRILNMFENTYLFFGGVTERVKFLHWPLALLEEKKQEHAKMQGKKSEKAILDWLLDAEPFNQGPHRVKLAGDVRLSVIAGSDTTANAFITLFFHLANSPRYLKVLQDEIDEVYASNLDFSPTDIEPVPREITRGGGPKTKILEGIINEALRINPTIPNGAQRYIPPEGLIVGDTMVPGGTLMWPPLYTLFRDPRVFSNPDVFMPERFYDNPAGKRSEDFIPFWAGKYSCVGKELAMANLRTLTTMIVKEFDIQLAEGWSEKKFMSGHKDTFTLSCGPFEAILTKRNRG